MNTKMIFLWLLGALLAPPSVWSQNLMWAKQMGGSSFNAGYAVAVDAQGHTYTAGIFDGTTDFDPGLGRFELTADTFSTHIFISKIGVDGAFHWARALRGQVLAMCVAENAVYVSGLFSGRVDFDPESDTVWRQSVGIQTGFILKLDAEGHFQWVKTLDGAAADAETAVNAVAIDALGRLYAAGYFKGTTDFGGTWRSSVSNSDDAFVARYEPDGTLTWVQTFGQNQSDRVQALAVRQGHVAVTGFFGGAFDYNTASGSQSCRSVGGIDGFVGRFDTFGQIFWIKNMGGARTDQGRSVALTPSGDCYVMGYFEEWADFNPDAGLLPLVATGLEDLFVMKWTASGQSVWAYALDAFSRETGQTVAVDAANNCLVLANFRESLWLPNTTNEMVSLGLNDIFWLKISPNGYFLSAECLGGFDNEGGYGLCTDSVGDIYMTGYFEGWMDADPSPALFEMGALGTYDAFVVKISNPATLPLEWLSVVLQPKTHRLDWALSLTAGEKGHIRLEKQGADGLFKTIDQWPLAEKGHYTLEKSNDISYYRLVAVGVEDRPIYSKVLVQMPDNLSDIKAYPSVWRDFFDLDLPETRLYEVSVWSDLGQCIWQGTVAGQQRIGMAHWPRGQYTVQVRYGYETATLKTIKGE